MYTGTTNSFNEILGGASRHFYCKFSREGEEITSGFRSVKITQQANPETDSFSIGGSVATVVEVQMDKPSSLLTGKEFQVSFGLEVDGKIEYCPVCVVTAEKPKEDDGLISFTAYDRMVSKLNYPYYTDITAYPVDAKVILREISNKTGVSIANLDSLPNGIKVNQIMAENEETGTTSKKDPFSGCTYRQAVKYIAQLYGTFATMNRVGELEFRWYTQTDYTVELNRSLNDIVVNEEEYEVQRIVCASSIVSSTYSTGMILHKYNSPVQQDSDGILSVGIGTTGITMENPVMTFDVMESLWEKLQGFKFTPVTVSFLGDCRLDLGDIITIKTRSGSVNLPIMGLMLEFDGGLTAEVGSYGSTEMQEASAMTTPTDRTVDYVNSRLLFVNELLANKVNTDYLKANYATIKELDAVEARIDKIVSTDITTEYLEANYATIEALNATAANINVLLADYATVTDLNAACAQIETLSADVSNFEQIYAKSAEITELLTDYAKVTELEAVSSTINNLDVKYAKIDFANVNVADIEQGFMKSLMVSQGLLADRIVSEGVTVTDCLTGVRIIANDIVAGRLDAAEIEVVNMNCANLTVGQINGQQIASGAIDMDKLAEELAGTITQTAEDVELALKNAGLAQTAAGNAQTTANGKNTVFYQASAPSTNGRKTNDIWFDTDDGNKMYRFNGTSWAAAQFGTNAIANASITNALIADATIQSAKIASLDAAKITTGALNAARIASLSITTDKLAANAVTAAKIAANAVNAANIVSGAVTADKLSAGAVTAEKIASRTLTADKIVAEAITANEIASSAITAVKIASNAVTAAKIASGAVTTDKLKAGAVTAEKISVSDLSALSATIGGFTIGATAIYSKENAFGSTAGNIYIGSSGISLGTTFKVTAAGALTATSGTIGGWTISSSYILKRSAVTSGTASTQYQTYLNAPASVSASTVAFYVQSRSYDGSAYGSWASKFYVRYDGYVCAVGGGKIGGWTIGTGTAGALYSHTKSTLSSTATGVYLGTDGISLGSTFRVTNAGDLTVVNGTIEGDIYVKNAIFMHRGVNGGVHPTIAIGDMGEYVSVFEYKKPDGYSVGLSDILTCNDHMRFEKGVKICGTSYQEGNGIASYSLMTEGGIDCGGDIHSNMVSAAGEIQTAAANSYRHVCGNYGTFWRNDGGNLYLLFTNSGNQYGSYNSLRPIIFALSTGNCTIGHATTIKGATTLSSTLTVSGSGRFNAGLELYGNTPFIDFHYNNSTADHTSRIIESSSYLEIQGKALNCAKGVYWSGKQCVYSTDNSVSWLRNCGNSYMEVQTSSGLYGVNWFASDARLKKDIEDTSVTALDYIKKIEHKQFEWKQDGREGVRCGYIAQQLEEIGLDVVLKIKQPEGSEIDELYQIDSTRLIPYLTKAIQELSAQIDDLKNKISTM